MKSIAACESIARTVATQVEQRLTGELVFKVVFNAGGIRRLVCDINELSCRHFEITEEKSNGENGQGKRGDS